MTALADKTVEIAAQETAAREALAAAEQEAKTELQKLAGQEALKEIQPANARRKRAAIEKKLAARRERVDVLAAAVIDVQRRAADETEKAHQAELRSSATKLAHALKARHSAGRAVARALTDAEHAAAEVRRHRALVDAAAATHSAKLHKGEKFTWPPGSHVDEGWELSRELAEFFEAGPVKPVAHAEEARVRARKIRDRQDREALRSFSNMPSEALLKTLGERLQPEARKILDEHRLRAEQQHREHDERTARRKLDRLGEERSRPGAPVA